MVMNLKKLRTEAGISQRELAEAFNVSLQTIIRYENNDIGTNITCLIRIAEYFNVSVDYLIGHSPYRHRAEKVHSFDLNKQEATVINGFRQLSNKQRKHIEHLIESINE